MGVGRRYLFRARVSLKLFPGLSPRKGPPPIGGHTRFIAELLEYLGGPLTTRHIFWSFPSLSCLIMYGFFERFKLLWRLIALIKYPCFACEIFIYEKKQGRMGGGRCACGAAWWGPHAHVHTTRKEGSPSGGSKLERREGYASTSCKDDPREKTVTEARSIGM